VESRFLLPLLLHGQQSEQATHSRRAAVEKHNSMMGVEENKWRETIIFISLFVLHDQFFPIVEL
jgi:hypothetical protein